MAPPGGREKRSLLEASQAALAARAGAGRARRRRDGDVEDVIAAAAAAPPLPEPLARAAARTGKGSGPGACGATAGEGGLEAAEGAVWGALGDREHGDAPDSQEGLLTPEEDSSDDDGWAEQDAGGGGDKAEDEEEEEEERRRVLATYGEEKGDAAPADPAVAGAALPTNADGSCDAGDGAHIGGIGERACAGVTGASGGADVDAQVVEFDANVEGRALVERAKSTQAATTGKGARVSAADKFRTEMVHKMHVMCIVARGQRLDALADSDDLRAMIVSHDADSVINHVRDRRASLESLGAFTDWFTKALRRIDGDGDATVESCVDAAAAMSVTEDQAAVICCAALRTANLPARLVVAVDAVAAKATVASVRKEGLQHAPPCSGAIGGSKAKAMVHEVSFVPDVRATTRGKQSAAKTLALGTAHRDKGKGKAEPQPWHKPDVIAISSDSDDNDVIVTGSTPAKRKATAATPQATDGDNEDEELRMAIAMSLDNDQEQQQQPSPQAQVSSRARQSVRDDAPRQTKHEPKRQKTSEGRRASRADAEEEAALAMAMQATAAAVSKPIGPAPKASLPPKELWKQAHMPRKSTKTKCYAETHWVEVFSESERRWLHVDPLSGEIDCPEAIGERRQKAHRPAFSYVVGFAGGGGKDVTRRYAIAWQVVVRMRTDARWWAALMAPLEARERAATNAITTWVNTSKPDTDDDVYEIPPPVSTAGASGSGCASGAGASGTARKGSVAGANANAKAARAAANVEKRLASGAGGIGGFVVQPTRAMVEEAELMERAVKEPLPTTIEACKRHPRYAMERHLTKYEAIHPRKVVGYVRGEAVFARSSVRLLHTRDKWLAHGRKVREGEEAFKSVSARTNRAAEQRKNRKEIERRKAKYANAEAEGELEQAMAEDGVGDDQVGVGDAGDGAGDDRPALPSTELFGEWQTDAWRPAAAEDPLKVPKNSRGQVDLFSDKMLPEGCAHVRLPRVAAVAKKLGVDYAPAMVGFERQKGRSVPSFDGIVVAQAQAQLVEDAWHQQEEERKRQAQQKAREEARATWRRLLRTLHDFRRFEAMCDDGIAAAVGPKAGEKSAYAATPSAEAEHGAAGDAVGASTADEADGAATASGADEDGPAANRYNAVPEDIETI